MKTEITREKMSASAKARCTSEWRRRVSESYRTKIDDCKLRNLYESGATQEEVATNLGVTRKVVYNAMRRLGIKARAKIKRDQWGDRNTSWHGAGATITCKHRRLYRMFGQPKKCDLCGASDESKTYDWANLTGDYDNPSDFKRMCRSCHRKYDNKRRKQEE